MLKRCYICEERKSVNDFGKHRSRKDGLQASCKSCRNFKMKAWYDDNRETHIARVVLVNEKQRKEVYSCLRYLKSQPCTDCNKSFDPVCMDFDHVTDDKSFEISEGVRRRKSLTAILNEIKKCELVCANCHRIRTKNRLNGVSASGEAESLISF